MVKKKKGFRKGEIVELNETCAKLFIKDGEIDLSIPNHPNPSDKFSTKSAMLKKIIRQVSLTEILLTK